MKTLVGGWAVRLVRPVGAIALAVAFRARRNAPLLILARVLVRPADERRTSVRLVRVIGAFVVAVADERRRDALAVVASEVIGGARSVDGRVVVTSNLVFAGAAISAAVASVVNWNAFHAALERFAIRAVDRSANVLIVGQCRAERTQTLGTRRSRYADVAAALLGAHVSGCEVELVNHLQDPELRRVFRGVYDEASSAFRLALIQPIHARRGQREPEDRVAAHVQGDESVEVRAERFSSLAARRHLLDSPAESIAEVQVVAIEGHGSDRAERLQEFTGRSAVHVSHVNALIQATFGDEHQAVLRCQDDAFRTFQPASQNDALFTAVNFDVAHDNVAPCHFGPVDVVGERVDGDALDSFRVLEQDLLTPSVQVHRVDDALAQVAVDDGVVQRVECQSANVVQEASR